MNKTKLKNIEKHTLGKECEKEWTKENTTKHKIQETHNSTTSVVSTTTLI